MCVLNQFVLGGDDLDRDAAVGPGALQHLQIILNMCVYIYIYIYIYNCCMDTYRERERERGIEIEIGLEIER